MEMIMGLIEKDGSEKISVVTNWETRSRISYYVDEDAQIKLINHVGKYALLSIDIDDVQSHMWTKKVTVIEIIQISPTPIDKPNE